MNWDSVCKNEWTEYTNYYIFAGKEMSEASSPNGVGGLHKKLCVQSHMREMARWRKEEWSVFFISKSEAYD